MEFPKTDLAESAFAHIHGIMELARFGSALKTLEKVVIRAFPQRPFSAVPAKL
jgi:hypothetical protein